jgi:hypothetical protein
MFWNPEMAKQAFAERLHSAWNVLFLLGKMDFVIGQSRRINN